MSKTPKAYRDFIEPEEVWFVEHYDGLPQPSVTVYECEDENHTCLLDVDGYPIEGAIKPKLKLGFDLA